MDTQIDCSDPLITDSLNKVLNNEVDWYVYIYNPKLTYVLIKGNVRISFEDQIKTSRLRQRGS